MRMNDFSWKSFFPFKRRIIGPRIMTSSYDYVVENSCSLHAIWVADNGEVVLIFVVGHIFYRCRVFELIPDIELFDVAWNFFALCNKRELTFEVLVNDRSFYVWGSAFIEAMVGQFESFLRIICPKALVLTGMNSFTVGYVIFTINLKKIENEPIFPETYPLAAKNPWPFIDNNVSYFTDCFSGKYSTRSRAYYTNRLSSHPQGIL